MDVTDVGTKNFMMNVVSLYDEIRSSTADWTNIESLYDETCSSKADKITLVFSLRITFMQS